MKRSLYSFTAVLLLLFLVLSGCTTDKSISKYNAGSAVFTLQLLHFADVDGNEETALSSVDEFSALAEAFKSDPDYGPSTLFISSGDNIIPGPRFYAAEQSAVRSVTGSNEPGHTDIAFMNALGVQASAMGNHDLDAGTGEFADAMQSEAGGGAEFPGAQFPYLSANLDWSTDEETAGMTGTDGATVEELKGKLAAYAVAVINGEKIGLVGASTPLLSTITSTGGITVKPSDPEDMTALAAIIQSAVDALTAKGINKIILLSHMQQIEVEMELITLLKDVDIVVAGGSNTRMGDKTDSLYGADPEFEMSYPYETMDAEGMPALIVNVDGDYKYLGRLVVSFDDSGYIIRKSLDMDINGAWASTAENAAAQGGTPSPDLVAVRDALQGVITEQYGNVLGYTSVYLDGRRTQVRTQETNLGDLSADANLWYANQLSPEPVAISLKNGGGLRTEIGSAIVPPGSTDYSQAVLSAPVPNREAGTAEGAVSEGHLRATLRFDNGLVVLSATAEEVKMLLEHGVAETGPDKTPGQFPQIGGMQFSFDSSKPAGSRILSLEILNSDGSVKEKVMENGVILGDPARRYRLVTLNFLANGGDNYPFDQLSNPNRMNLYEGKAYGEDTDYPDAQLTRDPGRNNSFSYTGGEQDAFAEYLMAFHSTPGKAYSAVEKDRPEDSRIRY